MALDPKCGNEKVKQPSYLIPLKHTQQRYFKINGYAMFVFKIYSFFCQRSISVKGLYETHYNLFENNDHRIRFLEI